MGAGCSSPLRRFGGKRGKQANRDSVSEIIADNDNPEQLTIAARLHAQEDSEQIQAGKQKALNLEKEITIQSEINDDHPSSASYYTDGKNLTETSQRLNDEHSVTINNSCTPNATKTNATDEILARMMGLNGAIPYDRHLLVSPALSPAPSICQSPAPNGSYTNNNSIGFDLNDLDEAFMTITLGSVGNQKIMRPARPIQSDFCNQYNQQFVQSREDLTNDISVVFITTYNTLDNEIKGFTEIIDNVASQVESQLRTICDEQSFNLRFLDLSYKQLQKCFLVNNLQDVALRILEGEYRENSQRMLIVILANGTTSTTDGSTNISQTDLTSISRLQRLDKRQLPTSIDVNIMNRALGNDEVNRKSVDLIKSWYNQVGNFYFLKPIYSIHPKILSKTKEDREQAWQSWLNDSSLMLSFLSSVCEDDEELRSSLALKPLINSYVEFIANEPTLQKRTLLVRNYLQGLTLSNQNSSQQYQATANANKSNINDLARLLPDPCKLTLKRSSNDEDFTKVIIDWITDNFYKHIDSSLDAKIARGKYVAPFIERNLFLELTRQRHYLEHYIDNITENFELKSSNFYNCHIKPILQNYSTTEYSEGHDLSNSKQSLQSQVSANHLVFISGPRGCGKSTLFAQLVKNAAQELSYRVQLIYRFCGLTIDSLNSNRLLRSICEQFCQTQGENTTAASYIYSSRRREIMDALNKITRLRSVLILLDGIELFNDQTESCLDWLCEIEANSRVKVIMTLETDSALYRKILSLYTDATYITLDNPTGSEWAHMLANSARCQRFNSSSGNLYEDLKNLDKSTTESDNITYKDTSNVLNMCRIRKLNNEYVYPELAVRSSRGITIESLKSVHQNIIHHLHYLMPPYLLCSLMIAIASSRNGLSEQEIIDLMKSISKKQSEAKSFVFSSSLFSYIKIQLRPWLRVIICDKITKLTIHKDFMDKTIDYYVPSIFPKIIGDIRDCLQDFYSRPFKQSQTRASKITSAGNDASDSSPKKSRENMSAAEKIWLGTQASETMNLLILTDPSKAKNYIMNKQQFYMQFINRSMPEEFVEDHERLKAIAARKLSQYEEIQNLVNYIRQSIFPLRYDGAQIYSQIYCRSFESLKSNKSSKSKKFNDILACSSCPPIWTLLPISETSIESFIKTRIGKNQPTSNISSSLSTTLNSSTNTSELQKIPPVLPSNQLRQPNNNSGPPTSYQLSSKQKIFTIKENHRHMIAIYPDKNCLIVWDIFEEKAVRVINDIDHPRDLRMIDEKRAVILCNRELRIYDLDSGSMLTKLKGVMNQKMPYFEVFKQEYVIALARNRMYVNMLNVKTGECETTFKVGEDRFLNSLLVSADGGICVCGDETQKPFPLLVWNLNERRLMYDLRLDRHEFITRLSAISEDGHFVVSVCKQLGDINETVVATSSTIINNSHNVPLKSQKTTPNFIVIYDLNSGTLFKKWKPGLDTCGVAISLTSNRSGKLINAIVDRSILVWDLTTGSKKHTLKGHSAPVDVIRIQNGRLFSMDSSCRDQSLRIWDIEEGYCLAVFSPDAPVSCCQISTRGDALVCGFAAETRLSTLVMCKNETVNEVIKRNKRRKSSKTLYIFDEPPNRKSSS